MTNTPPTTNTPLDAHDAGARRVQSVTGTKADPAREARIKAALKSNIARRKAQARARDEEDTADD